MLKKSRKRIKNHQKSIFNLKLSSSIATCEEKKRIDVGSCCIMLESFRTLILTSLSSHIWPRNSTWTDIKEIKGLEFRPELEANKFQRKFSSLYRPNSFLMSLLMEFDFQINLANVNQSRCYSLLEHACFKLFKFKWV